MKQEALTTEIAFYTWYTEFPVVCPPHSVAVYENDIHRERPTGILNAQRWYLTRNGGDSAGMLV
jgi:hypothetical protein